MPISIEDLARNLSTTQQRNFLSRVSSALRAVVIPTAPAGPWTISDNSQLQDCISVPNPNGDGQLQIGKCIGARALRPMLAADPANLSRIADVMDAVADHDGIPSGIVIPLVETALTWNRSMSLKVKEPDVSDDPSHSGDVDVVENQ